MKKETNKATEAQLLDLLKKVLPKATHDAQLAGKIYQAVELELKAKAKVMAFEKFCAKVELPDLEPKSIEDVKTQIAASFGDGDVTLKPNRKEKTLANSLMPGMIHQPKESPTSWLAQKHGLKGNLRSKN